LRKSHTKVLAQFALEEDELELEFGVLEELVPGIEGDERF
jgi:hypothetical protein